MSIITSVVKSALVLEQRVQAVISKYSHNTAGRMYNKAGTVEALANVEAHDTSVSLERLRAKRAASMIARHKLELTNLHENIDAQIDLNDGRRLQELAHATQLRFTAGEWERRALDAKGVAEKARQAGDRL